MPQELLRSATRVDRAPGRWFMIPASIAAHGAVAVACLVMPLTADGDLPIPGLPSGIIRYVKVAPAPPPVERRAMPEPAVRQERGVPTVAPPEISPERPAPSGAPPGPAVDGALPAGFGGDGGLPMAAPLLSVPPPPPPAPDPVRQPVPVGRGVREPRKIVDVKPVYPPLAIQARVEGLVILEAIIDVDGRIDRLRVLRSAPLLDEAAIAAVKQWRYTPTLLNGVPVPVLMTITVNFRLH